MKVEGMNIYQELGNFPRDVADKMTNAKSSGGRSLNAIHDSKLSSSEKHIMLFLGSQLNYTKDFINQYRYISLNKIAEKISMSKQSVLNLLNGYKTKNKIVIGLIEKGYIYKLKATAEEQIKGWSNHYCLSAKIFDEYLESMIDEYKSKEFSTLPSQTILPPQSNHLTPPSQTILPIVPSIQVPSLNPSLNAATQPAASKDRTRWKPKSEIKTWENKSEEEKFKSLIQMVRDTHRIGVKRKTAAYFDFPDIPDLLKPLVDLHGFEVIKTFLDKGRDERRGYNVRFLGQDILEWLDIKLDRSEPILAIDIGQEEVPLGDKIIEQMERNMNIDSKEKECAEILSNLPTEFHEWINSLTNVHQRLLAKDLKTMTDKNKYAYLSGIIERNKKIDLNIANKQGESIGTA